MSIASSLFSVDKDIFEAMNKAGSNLALDLAMVAFSIIGMSYILIFVVYPLWHYKRREDAIDVAILMVVSDLTSEILKLAFSRPRPFEVLPDVHMLHWGALTGASGYAFPSGHTVRAFAILVVIAAGCTTWKWRGLVLALAAMIGVSRIYLGLHWPSDVLGGALIGSGLALTMLWIREVKGQNSFERRLGDYLHRRFGEYRARRHQRT